MLTLLNVIIIDVIHQLQPILNHIIVDSKYVVSASRFKLSALTLSVTLTFVFAFGVVDTLDLPSLLHCYIRSKVCFIYTDYQHILANQLSHDASEPDASIVVEWIFVPGNRAVILDMSEQELLLKYHAYSVLAWHFQVRYLLLAYVLSDLLNGQCMQPISLDALAYSVYQQLIIDSSPILPMFRHRIENLHNL